MSLYPEKIESYEEGRAFTFVINDGTTRYRFTVPSELLDDQVGVMSTEATRKEWVEANLAHILDARPEGAGVNPPFNRIMVEEIS
ncbi:MAG: hypothetical protein R6V30_05225 [Paracoccaceae bacterium]|nr:hypothetical protein [Loktanella sp.]